MHEMRGARFGESGDFLNAAVFLQDLVATAMWRYHCNVGADLERFTREFDRLDIESERRRLFDAAQAKDD